MALRQRQNAGRRRVAVKTEATAAGERFDSAANLLEERHQDLTREIERHERARALYNQAVAAEAGTPPATLTPVPGQPNSPGFELTLVTPDPLPDDWPSLTEELRVQPNASAEVTVSGTKQSLEPDGIFRILVSLDETKEIVVTWAPTTPRGKPVVWEGSLSRFDDEVVDLYRQAEQDWDAAAKAAGHALPVGSGDAEKELASARTVAKEWVAAALTLFSLFSFTALFFGGDGIAALAETSPTGWTIAFLCLALVAVTAAVGCTFLGTRAAHGWPHSPTARFARFGRFGQDGLLPGADTTRKLARARGDLKGAIACAIVAVIATMFALGIVVMVPLVVEPAPANFVVELNPTITDPSPKPRPCGELVTATSDGITIDEPKENGPPWEFYRNLTPWNKVKTVTPC